MVLIIICTAGIVSHQLNASTKNSNRIHFPGEGHWTQARMQRINQLRNILSKRTNEEERSISSLTESTTEIEKVDDARRKFRTMQGARSDNSVNSTDIPFVFMVFKRADYLMQAIDSLKSSDFPRERVPIVISHDGKVPDVMEYVEEIKKDFKVLQLFHPFSCYEHPDSFPGKDESLNIGFKGDTYGNPRSHWATCCKHHFTWMFTTVFAMPELKLYDTFLFTEEDYILAPTIYHSICEGVNVMATTEEQTKSGYIGMVVDPTSGGESWFKKKDIPKTGSFRWRVYPFITGPMTLNRNVYEIIKAAAKKYCTIDEYNWDVTFSILMYDGMLPYSSLQPTFPLALHIGGLLYSTDDFFFCALCLAHFRVVPSVPWQPTACTLQSMPKKRT